MSRRTRFFYTLCALSAAVGLSCYRSSSDSVSSPSPAIASASARTGPVVSMTSESFNSSDATRARTDDQTAPEAEDAEEVLKSALARAAGEQKLVLVHLGAPG